MVSNIHDRSTKVGHSILDTQDNRNFTAWWPLRGRNYLKSYFFFSKKTYFTSYVRNMFYATILYKYPDVTAFGITKHHLSLHSSMQFISNTGGTSYFNLTVGELMVCFIIISTIVIHIYILDILNFILSFCRYL